MKSIWIQHNDSQDQPTVKDFLVSYRYMTTPGSLFDCWFCHDNSNQTKCSNAACYRNSRIPGFEIPA